MDATFCREAAGVMNSPYFYEDGLSDEEMSKRLDAQMALRIALSEVQSYDELPDEFKAAYDLAKESLGGHSQSQGQAAPAPESGAPKVKPSPFRKP